MLIFPTFSKIGTTLPVYDMFDYLELSLQLIFVLTRKGFLGRHNSESHPKSV